ncbi:hypothetical protein EVAR_79402_1 [Eumeta japonica]|uniref:Uncharacterized protein n=1 Tax=Eumeta variegata TaxID=151549 RepID=A0A4C1VFQ9_EUMVA|nr:hypothetical protein EVAR_79402_1 [Eumeta japonica]
MNTCRSFSIARHMARGKLSVLKRACKDASAALPLRQWSFVCKQQGSVNVRVRICLYAATTPWPECLKGPWKYPHPVLRPLPPRCGPRAARFRVDAHSRRDLDDGEEFGGARHIDRPVTRDCPAGGAGAGDGDSPVAVPHQFYYIPQINVVKKASYLVEYYTCCSTFTII